MGRFRPTSPAACERGDQPCLWSNTSPKLWPLRFRFYADPPTTRRTDAPTPAHPHLAQAEAEEVTGRHAGSSRSGVFLPYLKAYTTLIGSVCTALLAIYTADAEVGKILTAVSVVATVVGTWAVPNLDPAGERQAESVQPPESRRFDIR